MRSTVVYQQIAALPQGLYIFSLWSLCAHKEHTIFGPTIFPLFAAIHLALTIIALGAWPAAPAAALCIALVEFVNFFDNAVAALGNWLGISNINRGLNRARFFLHAICIGFLLPGYAGIGSLAGASGFDATLFNGMIAALTSGIILFGYFVGYRQLKRITPINYYGCLRYAQTVNPTSRRDDYRYSAEELEQKGLPPFAAIITVVIGLMLSIWIGISAGFWIPAFVTGLILLAGRFPANEWGALATSCLEIIFSMGIVYSLVRLA
jgi:hypothetical protein